MQFNFIFDTKGFNNAELSNVEIQRNYLCGFERKDVIKGTVEATPTLITFKWVEPSFGQKSYNIDRKTLRSGTDTNRDFSCELLDIDTSENLL